MGYTIQNEDGAGLYRIAESSIRNFDGTHADDPSNDVLILTVEGIAPYTTFTPGPLQANAARRFLEARLRRSATSTGWDVVTVSVNQRSTVCP